MDVIVKPPSECTEIERAAFLAYVLDGGEVGSAGLEGRIDRAEKMLFLTDDASGLVGISALKRPDTAYRDGVFKACGLDRLATQFNIEIGWIYLVNRSRGRGLSLELVDPLLDIVAARPVFATTRVNNLAINSVLPKRGFRLAGTYPSANGQYELNLFLRP
jgi:RimJ/RimL family protein N-acetyltransferase